MGAHSNTDPTAGEASVIYPLSDGTLRVEFWNDGLRRQVRTGTKDRSLALLIEHKVREREILRRFGLADHHPEMPVEDLVREFCARANVKRHHEERIKIFIPHLHDIPIGRLTRSVAEQYRRFRLERDGVTNATINRDLEVLRHLLFWAVDEGLLQVNPLARLRMVHEKRTARPVMSVAEEELLLKAAAPHLRPIIIIGLDAGLRRGEILGQLWQDVDRDRNVLYVTKSKTAGGVGREVPLTSRVSQWINEHWKPKGLLFTFHCSAISSIKTSWATALHKSGIRHFRFHDLRHSYATRLLDCGVVREVRQALLGHSTGRNVHDGYLHIETPMKRTAVQKLENWWNEQRRLIEGRNSC
jgi:integrase